MFIFVTLYFESLVDTRCEIQEFFYVTVLSSLCFISPFLFFPPTHPTNSLFPKDVSDIKYVINYDFPNNTEDYIHRIGRTARAENTGNAYTFFTSSNAKQAKELIEVLREANQSINPKLYDMMQLAKTMMQSKCELWWMWMGIICAVEICCCGGGWALFRVDNTAVFMYTFCIVFSFSTARQRYRYRGELTGGRQEDNRNGYGGFSGRGGAGGRSNGRDRDAGGYGKSSSGRSGGGGGGSKYNQSSSSYQNSYPSSNSYSSYNGTAQPQASSMAVAGSGGGAYGPGLLPTPGGQSQGQAQQAAQSMAYAQPMQQYAPAAVSGQNYQQNYAAMYYAAPPPPPPPSGAPPPPPPPPQ